MNLVNPLAHVIGRGSAKAGVEHWWMQRLTAVALVPLTLWVVYLLLRTQAADYASVHALVASPLNAALLIAWLIAMLWHAQLGLQVVIEDYIHTPWLEVGSLVAIKLASLLGMIVAVVSVLRIAVGGA